MPKWYKYAADRIFTGTQMLDENLALICNEKGVVQSIVSIDQAGDDVQTFTGILTPGFINAHCHLELSHLKNQIPIHTGMVPFLQGVMGLRETPEEIKAIARRNAVDEMKKNGIVAVGDICNTNDTIADKINVASVS
jgi:aminodeoxyfutalosine deaminase